MAAGASAALVDNGSCTTDMVNGLDWLDIDRTQVATLWTEVGITDKDQFLGGTQFAAVDDLLDLIAGSLVVGTTSDWYSGTRLQGLTGQPMSTGSGYNWAAWHCAAAAAERPAARRSLRLRRPTEPAALTPSPSGATHAAAARCSRWAAPAP